MNTSECKMENPETPNSKFPIQNSKFSLPRYDRYKDSGVEWLGEIPEHWAVESLRAAAELFTERNRSELPVLSVYREYGVILKDSRDDNHNSTSLDTSSYKVVRPGDLAINKMKAWQGSLGVSEHHGIVSPAYITCRLNQQKVTGRYIHYLLRSKPLIGALDSISYGVRVGQWDMRFEDFKKVGITIPPKAEQDRIVAFLDQKTAEIDALIAKKQRQIELLDEQKAILINRAVTRGLNPKAKLKPSGIEWIGDIPEHWEVGKVRHLFDNLNHRRVPLSTLERGKMKERKYDYYGASGVIDQVEDFLYDEDLLLIAEDGANLVFRNLPLAIIATGKYWVNNHAHILRPTSGPLHYWFYALECADYTTAITGAAQPKLTKDALASISLPNPPVQEQRQILAHIQRNEHVEAKLRRTIQSQLESLKTLRSSLIAHAVTGRIRI